MGTCFLDASEYKFRLHSRFCHKEMAFLVVSAAQSEDYSTKYYCYLLKMFKESSAFYKPIRILNVNSLLPRRRILKIWLKSLLDDPFCASQIPFLCHIVISWELHECVEVLLLPGCYCSLTIITLHDYFRIIVYYIFHSVMLNRISAVQQSKHKVVCSKLTSKE